MRTVASTSAEPLTSLVPFQITGADLMKTNEHVEEDGGNPETSFSARQLTYKVTVAVVCQHVCRACACGADS